MLLTVFHAKWASTLHTRGQSAANPHLAFRQGQFCPSFCQNRRNLSKTGFLDFVYSFLLLKGDRSPVCEMEAPLLCSLRCPEP